MDRASGLTVRLKLTLSYAGFLLVAGVLLLAAVWLFLLRYVPDRALIVPGSTGTNLRGVFPVRSNLLHVFAPRAAAVLALLLVFGLVLACEDLLEIRFSNQAPAAAQGLPCTSSCASAETIPRLASSLFSFMMGLPPMQKACEAEGGGHRSAQWPVPIRQIDLQIRATQAIGPQHSV